MLEKTSFANLIELRLFRSVFLTVIVFGVYNALLSGKFLVPLPAFEIAILGLCIFLAFSERKSGLGIPILFILFGLFCFLSRSYNFNFFMSDESIQALSETLWIDLFYIASAFFLAFLCLAQGLKANWGLVLTYILPIALLVTLLLPYSWLFILPLSVICIFHLRKKSLFINGHSIWAYLLLFTVSRELTLNLL